MLNIIILAAGLGSRFKDTHDLPKPLIPVNGVPMLAAAVKSLDIDAQYHFVLRKEPHLQELISVIHALIPSPNIIVVSGVTSGAAASALLLEDHIDTNDELIIKFFKLL